MKSLCSVLIPIVAAATLSACSFVKSAQQGFHSGFRSSFKDSFVKSCTVKPGMKDYCVCAADDVMAHNSDDQLMAMTGPSSESTKAALDHAAQACRSKIK